jgi:hypothetical protein
VETKLDPNKPEYPTEQQMDTMFNAYLKGGEAGILAALKAARQERGQNRAQDIEPNG